MTIIELINQLRSKYNKSPVKYWDNVMANYCRLHNLAMSKIRSIYHTDSYYLNEWKEIVCSCSFRPDVREYLINEVIDKSEEHKNILLNCDILAYDIFINNWIAYLTIRGKCLI